MFIAATHFHKGHHKEKYRRTKIIINTVDRYSNSTVKCNVIAADC